MDLVAQSDKVIICGLWNHDAVNLSLQVGSSAHALQMQRVLGVEIQGRGEALWSRPEVCSLRGLGVLWESVHKLRDSVVEEILEVHAHPLYTLLVSGAPVCDEHVQHTLHRLACGGVPRLANIRAEVRWLGQELIGLRGRLVQESLKLRPRPRQAVIDDERERVQRAHGRLLLRGVARGAVVLRQVGDHHLSVALGAQGTALE
mmetsp:Transcript_34559/g.66034  ORF Transcript_34559/g.66034 Transcript_34559/m.66034 type:complete len:203 (-) Transcript_34559:1810-2418(-)